MGDLSGSTLPSAVLDSKGNTVSDPLLALKVWRDYAEQLGQDKPVPTSDRRQSPESAFDEDFAEAVRSKLRCSLADGGSLLELNSPITWEEVHTAIRQLQAGKTPGPDGIPNELLMLAGLGFEIALQELFNDIWSSMSWPSMWRVANLIPLYKKAGNKLDPSNHRLLAMMSTVPKVFEKILDVRIRSWAERAGALSDYQGGFRSDRSTVDQVFILNEIMMSRKESDTATFMMFVDIAKAYDRVWRPGLWAN